jgi:hypothetical protein
MVTITRSNRKFRGAKLNAFNRVRARAKKGPAANLGRRCQRDPEGILMSSYLNTVGESTKTCPHCSGIDLFTESRPPHIALVCRSCSRWIRWVPKTQATNFPVEPGIEKSPKLELVPRRESPTATPTPCDHTRQLDLLIESMNRCSRHLEIITRAMCNGVGR